MVAVISYSQGSAAGTKLRFAKHLLLKEVVIPGIGGDFAPKSTLEMFLKMTFSRRALESPVTVSSQ